jgi:hypothetical protein
MLGSPDYIAPEQIRDARGADIRADIYSLGCTLYYLLAGGPPFPATSLYELLQAHHSMDALPLNRVRPEVPGELAALVARMMAKEPEDRFQTPAAVAQALTPFFKQSASQSSNTSVDPPRSSSGVGSPAEAKARADGVAWESLIATREHENPSDSGTPRPAPSELIFAPRPIGRPPWMTWPLVAAASVLGLTMLGVIIAITTIKGTVKTDLGDARNAARTHVDDFVIERQLSFDPAVTTSETNRSPSPGSMSPETTDRPTPKTARKQAASRSPDRKADDGFATWQAANDVIDRSVGTIKNGSLRQTTNPAEFDAILSTFNPNLTLSTRAAGTGGLAIVDHLGRTGVLRTHPVNQVTPCVLSTHVEVQHDKKTKLILDVAHDSRGDWQLIVKGNGQPLHDSIVGRTGRGDSWRTITVDLTQFAGETVRLELLNKATGWRFEFGFWGRIAIVSEKNPPGSNAVARKTPAPDPAPVGSSWVGRRRFSGGNEQICELKITSRNKGHFRGEMILLNVRDRSHFLTVKVEGDIMRQNVQFRSEQKAGFQQDFIGTLKNRQMHLEFSGMGKGGTPTQGEAILTQEP